MKKNFIFTILIFVISSFANKWKPDEWLLTTPILIPSPTEVEKNEIDKSTKNKEQFPKSFYQRIFDSLPNKCVSNTIVNDKIIMPWGTTEWQIVSAARECPEIVNPIPQCSIFLAAKYWISSEKQEAELRFGSDDAVKLWLNNEHIFTHLGTRGYKHDAEIQPVSLKKGTNIFVFAVINGIGPAMVGSRLYPEKSAIYPGLFLDTENFVETGEFIELDFYWMPTAIVKPRKKVYEDKPKCEKIEVLDFAGNAVTQILGVEIKLPVNIYMHDRSNGIYRIKSNWNGKTNIRSFYYCGFPDLLTRVDKWKKEILENNDFFSPETYLNEILGDGSRLLVNNKPGLKRIHAYKSKYDNTIQPYIVIAPKNNESTNGLPLIVDLRPYVPLDKQQFIREQKVRHNTSKMVQVWPYSRGCNGFKGLSELDVLDVIELVCKKYKIDRNKIYLQGISLGGGGCWRIGGRYPDLFAAIMPDCGYDLTYCNNLLSLPVIQIWGKSTGPGNWFLNMIKHLRNQGANFAYTDLRKLNPEEIRNHTVNRANQLLKRKRNSQPDKVVYSTYGDIDGAYWVRNIMPEWFGRMATVEAEIQKECPISNTEHPISKYKEQSTNCGLIQVRTENVSSFSLDLREGRFLKFKDLEIVINDEIKTNAVSGEMFAFEFKDKIPLPPFKKGGLLKRNGFCGGICDVVCDSFIFAYSAEDEKSKERAVKFNYAITGIRPNQFDGNFKVISDTELTPEICAKNNVVLFTSNDKPGEFLEGNIEKMPFEMLEGRLAFNSVKKVAGDGDPPKDDLACVTFPNPLASNRYLLTVTMTNFTPRILIREHNDIILGYRRGSFDKNWDKIQWQDEYQSHKYEHKHNEHNCSECGNQHEKRLKNQFLEKHISSKNKNKPWKKYGMILCFLGIAVFYAYDFFVKRKNKSCKNNKSFH